MNKEAVLQLINQFMEINQKIEQNNLSEHFQRNFQRIYHVLEESGYIVNNPLNEKYTDTRTDIEASIVGKLGKNMIISKVVKPIVYQKNDTEVALLQKGIVIVENR